MMNIKNTILVSLLLLSSSLMNAQDNKVKNCDNVDQKKIAVYLTLLGGGYTHWTSNYYYNNNGINNNTYSLRGNGVNLGPMIALYYSFGKRAKLGVNGSYQYFFINRVKPNDGITRDVFKQDNNRRRLLRTGGSFQFDFIGSNKFGIIGCLDGGTFWIYKDNFAESTRSRYFGQAGLMFEAKMGGISWFIEPSYALYRYKIKNLPENRKSYLHTINVSIGIALKF
jgi:hypothetical protein